MALFKLSKIKVSFTKVQIIDVKDQNLLAHLHG